MARLKIGDIIEIKTQKGLSYAQYTHKNKLLGTLLRVFSTIYAIRPVSYEKVIEDDLRFTIFFPLQAAINQKIVEVVSNLNIPLKYKNFPLFRTGVINPKTDKVDTWWLWDGDKELKIGKLNNEQKQYPIRGIWNDTLLIERIDNDWKPKPDSYV